MDFTVFNQAVKPLGNAKPAGQKLGQLACFVIFCEKRVRFPTSIKRKGGGGEWIALYSYPTCGINKLKTAISWCLQAICKQGNAHTADDIARNAKNSPTAQAM